MGNPVIRIDKNLSNKRVPGDKFVQNKLPYRYCNFISKSTQKMDELDSLNKAFAHLITLHLDFDSLVVIAKRCFQHYCLKINTKGAPIFYDIS